MTRPLPDIVVLGTEGVTSSFQWGTAPTHIWTTGAANGPWNCIGGLSSSGYDEYYRPEPACGRTEGLEAYVTAASSLAGLDGEELGDWLANYSEICHECREAFLDEWTESAEEQAADAVGDCHGCGAVVRRSDPYIERRGEMYCDIDCLNGAIVL